MFAEAISFQNKIGELLLHNKAKACRFNAND